MREMLSAAKRGRELPRVKKNPASSRRYEEYSAREFVVFDSRERVAVKNVD
jgi:hypothetical protein